MQGVLHIGKCVGRILMAVLCFGVHEIYGEGAIGGALNGAAAIVSAVGSAVVPGIQAAADVDITRMNNQTTKELAKMGQDTTLALANQSLLLGTLMSQSAERIYSMNLQGELDRQKALLNEVAAQRIANGLERERESRYNHLLTMRALDMQEKYMEYKWKLTYQLTKMQLAQAGLSQGVKSIDSGKRLGVTPVKAVRPASSTAYGATLAKAFSRPNPVASLVSRAMTRNPIARGSIPTELQRDSSDLASFQTLMRSAQKISTALQTEGRPEPVPHVQPSQAEEPTQYRDLGRHGDSIQSR